MYMCICIHIHTLKLAGSRLREGLPLEVVRVVDARGLGDSKNYMG